MIRDTIYGLGINHYLSKNDKIRNVFSNFGISIKDRVACLLIERNFMMSKIDDKSLLIRFFMIPMPQSIQDSKSTTDNPFGFHHMNPISSICVHPVNLWLNFFKLATGRQVRGGGCLASRWRIRHGRILRSGWRGF